MGKTQVENFSYKYISSLAWENSQHFKMFPLVSCAMIPEKGVQKFHTDDASLPRTGKCFWLVMPRGKFAPTNQKHYPDLGSDASSVWNFCTCFLDLISQGNQRRHREVSSYFLRLYALWIWNLMALIRLRCWHSRMLCIALLLTLILAHYFIHLIMVNQQKWVHALFKMHRRLLQLYVCRNLYWLKHQ